jgi:photosystem II reaction center protein PsbP
MRITTITTIAILVVIVSGSTSTQGLKAQTNLQSSTTEKLLSYGNKEYGFTIQYPSNWYLNEIKNKKNVDVNFDVNQPKVIKQGDFSLDISPLRVNIHVHHITGGDSPVFDPFVKNVTLQLYHDNIVNTHYQIFQIHNYNPSKLGGKDAYSYEYVDKANRSLHFAAYTIYNNNVYEIDYVADSINTYDTYKKIVDQMIQSFRIL